MKAFVKANKATILSFCVIAALFLTVAVSALLFNEVTPGALLSV